jgi:hypothetical protein
VRASCLRVGGQLRISRDSLVHLLRTGKCAIGTAEAERLADEIVRQATASRGGERRTSTPSSYAECRSKGEVARTSLASSPDLVFWKYLTSPLYSLGSGEAPWSPERYLIEPAEQRVLGANSIVFTTAAKGSKGLL